jgi:hypothetical protein
MRATAGLLSGHPACRVCAIAPIRTPAGSRLIQIGVCHLMPSNSFSSLVYAASIRRRAGSTLATAGTHRNPGFAQCSPGREQGRRGGQLAWARILDPTSSAARCHRFKTKTDILARTVCAANENGQGDQLIGATP